MQESVEGRLIRQETKMESHETLDDQRFDTVCKDVADIKAMVRENSDFLQNGFRRVHDRIDDEAAKARHALNNEISKVKSDITSGAKETARLERWIYSTAVVSVVGALVYVVTNWGPLAK